MNLVRLFNTGHQLLYVIMPNLLILLELFYNNDSNVYKRVRQAEYLSDTHHRVSDTLSFPQKRVK